MSLERAKPEQTDVVVLCGGRGSRLGTLTATLPKPLLPVNDEPFLLHVLIRLQQEGFRRFFLAACYFAELFRKFAARYREQVPGIEVVVEPSPLGTGGAIRYAAKVTTSTELVIINGDSWATQRIAPVLAAHTRKARAFTAIAVDAAKVQGGAVSKGVWTVGAASEILGFSTQTCESGAWVNAGMYVISRQRVLEWPEGAYSLEERMLALIGEAPAAVFCSTSRLLDIGTPECYELAQRFVMAASPTPAGSGSRR